MKARILAIIMVVALIALPIMAQEWQSTSTMQGTGSSYSSQVTAVGAASAVSEATTTDSYSPAKAPGMRKAGSLGLPSTPDTTGDPGNVPVGDALIPLMLMALAFGGYIAVKRRKQTAKN